MTSLNETSRKTRIHTTLAAILALTSIGGLTYLGFQLNGLNQRYGQIAGDITYFTSERDRLQLGRTGLLTEVTAIAGELTEKQEELNRRREERDATAKERDANLARRDQLVTEIEGLSARLAAANETVSKAAELAAATQTLTVTKRTLETDIAKLAADRDVAARVVKDLKADSDLYAQLLPNLADLDSKISAKRAELDAASAKVSSLTVKLAGLEAREEELKDIDARISTAQTNVAAAVADAKAGKAEIAQLNSTINDLNAQQISLTQKLLGLAQSREKTASNAGMAEARLVDLNSQVNSAQVRLDNITSQIASQDKALSDARQTVNAANADRGAAENELARLAAQIAAQTAILSQIQNADQTLSEMVARIPALDAELARRVNDLEAARTQLSAITTDNKAAERSLIQTQTEAAGLLDQIKSASVAKTALDTELQKLRAEKNQLGPEVLELQKQLAEIQVAIKIQEQKTSSVRDSASIAEAQKLELDAQIAMRKARLDALTPTPTPSTATEETVPSGPRDPVSNPPRTNP